MLEAIKECHEAGKGVFSMKALGGGCLTGHYQEALDYVFSKPEIDSVMIGFGKIEEVDDLLSYLEGTMEAEYNPDISRKKCTSIRKTAKDAVPVRQPVPQELFFTMKMVWQKSLRRNVLPAVTAVWCARFGQ